MKSKNNKRSIHKKSRQKKTQNNLNHRIGKIKTANEKLKEALRRSKVLNRALFEHSPVGISIRTHSGDLLFVNKAWKKIWGLTTRQVKINDRKTRHLPLSKRYPYLKGKISKFKRVFQHGGELFLPELKVEHQKTGATMWISQYYYAIQDRHKKVEQIVILTQDITEPKTAEMALREIDTRFRTIVENVNVGVYRTTGDPEGHFVQVNPAMVKMFGCKSLKELLETKVLDLYHDRKERKKFIKELKRKKFVRNREILLQKKDGKSIWVSVYARAQFNDKGQVKWIDGVLEDITKRKQKEDQLRALSLIDDLTGLYNRRGFMTLAEHQLKIASRKKKAVILLFIDLDNLKAINDEFGHSIGDRALIEMTNILKATFRKYDIIARIGGDEFVVLTSETGATRAKDLYIRLQTSLESFNKKTKLPFVLKLSIGWAHHNPEKPQTVNKLLSMADRSMYRHKQSKKGLQKVSE
jgi:diguanylate cyclase (GGDEF)-like protein/PAS domain S-box-containing protein